MDIYRTTAIVLQVPRRRNWRLLFGSPRTVRRSAPPQVGATLGLAEFLPGDVWGMSRQTLNDFGVTFWEVLVLRAVRPGEPFHEIPGVKPGARALMHLTGKPAATRALRLIQMLDELGLTAEEHPELLEEAGRRIQGRVFPERLVLDYAQAWNSAS